MFSPHSHTVAGQPREFACFRHDFALGTAPHLFVGPWQYAWVTEPLSLSEVVDILVEMDLIATKPRLWSIYAAVFQLLHQT